MKLRYLLILSLAFTIWSQETRGQNLRLIIKNPLPRINQAIQYGYFYTNSDIQNRFEANLNNDGENNLISGDITINDSIKSASQITLGPIEIRYNGKSIKSDSFTITVFDALPDTNQGIWINQVSIEGSLFLIIEQRFPLTLRKFEYASFNRQAFLKFDIDPFEYYTQTLTYYPTQGSSKNKEYKERRTILMIRNPENLKRDLIINEDFFTNLPRDCQPINLVIQMN